MSGRAYLFGANTNIARLGKYLCLQGTCQDESNEGILSKIRTPLHPASRAASSFLPLFIRPRRRCEYNCLLRLIGCYCFVIVGSSGPRNDRSRLLLCVQMRAYKQIPRPPRRILYRYRDPPARNLGRRFDKIMESSIGQCTPHWLYKSLVLRRVAGLFISFGV